MGNIRQDKMNAVFLISIGLLYSISAMLGVGKNWVLSEASHLWYSHFSFMAFLAILLVLSNLMGRVLCGFFDNTGGLLLFFFFLHYLISALWHSDPIVSSIRMSNFFKYILPGFLLGISAFGDIRFSHMISKIRRTRKLLKYTKFLVFLLSLFLSLIFLKSLTSLFLSNPFNSSSLSLDPSGSGYQSFSMYVLVAYCLVLALFLIFHSDLSKGFLTGQLFFLFVAVVTAFLAFITAFVGSKKEVLAIFLLFGAYNFYLFFRFTILGKLKIKKWQMVSIFFPLLCFCFFMFVSGYDLQLPQLKVFDYGKGINTGSFFGRLEILATVGLLQLQDSPIMGNIGVEHKYGGQGVYIHSLISVQSHLGIIGSISLLGYFLHRLLKLYKSSDLAILKIMTPVIIFVCLISSFFVWFPLWFLIGGLFVPVCIKPKLCFRKNC